MPASQTLVRRLSGGLLLSGMAALLLAARLASVRAAPPMQPTDTSTPTPTPLDHIVISEFRPRGPGGASDEFIELFNPSGGAIDISGWVVKKSSSCGPTVNQIATIITATLDPGKHFLLANTASTLALTPDQQYPSSIADDGGIALLNPSSTPVDQVGMCATTAYFEGTPLPPFPAATADQSYERKLDASGGCVDTDNNAADFILRSTSDPQNSASPLGSCANPTSTPPPTNTPTPSKTPTPTPAAALSVLINEVGWAGTLASSSDEWIELYNTTGAPIDLSGWHLTAADGSPNIALSGTIPAGGYFVLGRASGGTATPPGCTVFNPADVSIQQTFSGVLSNDNEILYLKDSFNTVVDSANSDGGAWPAGLASPYYASMERRGKVLDHPTAWVTYAGPTTSTPRDCNGNRVRGTPGRSNWAITVTITPSPTPTRYKTPTPRPPTPFAHVVLNEFLPRPGFDWNHDGTIDVFDEFIEVENLGPIDVDLANWKLDDEANLGSSPFTLPSKKLKPGERALFYGATTHILLDDSGDSVRLINPRGVIVDARTYGPIKFPDQSHCRIPDGEGYWRHPCFPTPGMENTLSGSLPAPPPTKAAAPPVCLLADSVPPAFRAAECAAFGAEIWNRRYWDAQSGDRLFLVPDPFNKWQTFVE